MQGCIIQVWFEKDTETRPAGGKFCIIETELPDFATACEMVDANRLIGGAILHTQKQGRGEPSIITKRTPIAFRGEAVMRMQLPFWRFVEDDE